jgi:hypothetical protein
LKFERLFITTRRPFEAMGKAKGAREPAESIPEPSPPSPPAQNDDDAADSDEERAESGPKPQNDKMKARMEKLAQLRKKIVGGQPSELFLVAWTARV